MSLDCGGKLEYPERTHVDIGGAVSTGESDPEPSCRENLDVNKYDKCEQPLGHFTI